MISLKKILEGVNGQQTLTRIKRELRDHFEDEELEIEMVSQNPTVYKPIGYPGYVIKRRNRYLYIDNLG